VIEEDVGISMAHLKCGLVLVFVHGEMVGGGAVAENVVGPCNWQLKPERAVGPGLRVESQPGFVLLDRSPRVSYLSFPHQTPVAQMDRLSFEATSGARAK
jgi:hypothetical protein